MRFEDQRKWMVKDQLEGRNITDKSILEAFRKVPRHLFVPADLRHLSYEDSPLMIGEGQTISQPFTVAFMLQLADLKPFHQVLEIGTGSGYQTALLSVLVDHVYTMERIPYLSKSAQILLDQLSCKNVVFEIGDGSTGWKSNILFDRIIVTAAAPDVPESLLNQLKSGGELIIPTGEKGMQSMLKITKLKNGIETKNYGNFSFVPLIGEEGWNL